MTRLEALRHIAEQAARGELDFPTDVAVSLRVRTALDDPDCHVDAAARLVQAEPLLAARVVAMANSVAYNRSGRQIADVRSAVTRLGFATLRSLAMALVTRQMAGHPGSPGRQRAAAQLWAHTTQVAALARVIAQKVTKQNPDTALFAGLVHEIGGFYLLSRAEAYPVLLEALDPATPAPAADPAGGQDGIDDPEGEIERELSLIILRRLAVPEEIVSAVSACGEGYLALPPASLGDTLLLADELTAVRSPLRRGEAGMDGERALGSVDLAVGEDTLAEILRAAQDEVGSLTQALAF